MERIVIVGGGFGGLEAARRLTGRGFAITLVDRQNHHLFQPLLYQVATAALSPADIATPIRRVLRRAGDVEVRLGEVVGVDSDARRVRLADGGELPYDALILATGATHAYFGHPEWAEAAPGLKSLDDATELRSRILLAFERAEAASDPAERAAWLTFVVVGAGPTGVEMAGAIAELAHRTLVSDFRRIDPSAARVILAEAGPRVLPAFDPALSAAAAAELGRLGVDVRLGAPVASVDDAGVRIGDAFVPARTTMWAAGVQASPAAAWLDAPADRAGRVAVGPDCAVPGRPGVFAVGDTAAFAGPGGAPLPGVAQVALQQGAYVADLLVRQAAGRPAPPPFRYRDKGSMATIGRGAAVAQAGQMRASGLWAWFVWLFIHLWFLIGFRNRLVVLASWAWSYVTFDRGARLIVGAAARRPRPGG